MSTQAQATMPDPLFDTYLKLFAKNRSEEVSASPKINFVSTNIAIDFFEEGKKIGEQEFKKKIKENIEKRMAEQTASTLEIISHLISNLSNKNLKIVRLLISINVDCSKILLTVPEEQHYKDNFMNMFYPLASELEDTYSKDGFHFHISALDDTDKINYELLKSDGYNFCYDVENKTKVF